MRYVRPILFGVTFAAAGIALYVFVLQKMCWSPAFYCGAYNFLAALMTAYGNFVMQFVRPECVGGGSDDCIAQALTIMMATLLVIGWILGWWLFRKQKSEDHQDREKRAKR